MNQYRCEICKKGYCFNRAVPEHRAFTEERGCASHSDLQSERDNGVLDICINCMRRNCPFRGNLKLEKVSGCPDKVTYSIEQYNLNIIGVTEETRKNEREKVLDKLYSRMGIRFNGGYGLIPDLPQKNSEWKEEIEKMKAELRQAGEPQYQCGDDCKGECSGEVDGVVHCPYNPQEIREKVQHICSIFDRCVFAIQNNLKSVSECPNDCMFHLHKIKDGE